MNLTVGKLRELLSQYPAGASVALTMRNCGLQLDEGHVNLWQMPSLGVGSIRMLDLKPVPPSPGVVAIEVVNPPNGFIEGMAATLQASTLAHGG